MKVLENSDKIALSEFFEKSATGTFFRPMSHMVSVQRAKLRVHKSHIHTAAVQEVIVNSSLLVNGTAGHS